MSLLLNAEDGRKGKQDGMSVFSKERRRKRAKSYTLAFGKYGAKWLLLREAFGDTGCVCLNQQGSELLLRLNTTDILVWSSIYERQEYCASLPFSPKLILDIGAYTGLSTVYFARKYPDATVIAVEPDTANFEILKKNIQPFQNVVPLNKALWHEEGLVTLYDRSTGHWAFSLTPPATDECPCAKQVEAVTIDGLLALFDFDLVDILKIDVEGAEKEIFEHSREWIGRVGAIFIELHDRLRPGCTDAFEAATVSFEQQEKGPMTILSINNRLFDNAASME